MLLSIVKDLLASPQIERIAVFCSPMEDLEFPLIDHPAVEWLPISRRMATMHFRPLWATVGLPRRLRADDDVLLALTGTGLSGRTPRITYFQQALVLPEELGGSKPAPRLLPKLAVIRALMRASMRSADLVAVQSNFMRLSVAKVFAVEEDRIIVVHPSLPHWPQDRMPGTVPGAYMGTPATRRFLYVGDGAPHKNTEVLYRGMSLAVPSLPSARLFATLDAGEGPSRDWFVGLGQMPLAQLGPYYRHATALIMPSFAETLGLPMLEALDLGLPVIASNRPYAREICGDAAIYFDPERPEELADCLIAVANDERLPAALAHNTIVQKSRLMSRYRPGALADQLVRLALTNS